MLVPGGPEWAGLGDAPLSAAGVGAPGVADPAGVKLSTPNHHLSEQPPDSGIYNCSPFILSYTHNNNLSVGHFLSINDQLGLMALACAFSHQLLPTGH